MYSAIEEEEKSRITLNVGAHWHVFWVLRNKILT
jgi:hypothetical protein